MEKQGFPDGSVVKNPPANAGDKDSTPGLVRFQRTTWAKGQLGPCATATEQVVTESRSCNY